MNTTGHLDYLAATYPVGILPSEFERYTGDWKDAGQGPHGYERRLVSKNGATLLDKGTMQMGVHVVLKGAQLEAIRVDSQSELELIDFVATKRGKVSRIDLCVNMFGATVTVSELWSLWEQKQVKTNVRKAKRYLALENEGSDDGFYLGTRDSDKFLRIYNKGRQLGEVGAHIRLELECHKMRANAMALTIRRERTVREVVNKAILEHAAFYNEEYLLALQDNCVDIEPLKKPEPAFYKWLREQVAPALAKRQRDYPDENVMERLEAFVDEVNGFSQSG